MKVRRVMTFLKKYQFFKFWAICNDKPVVQGSSYDALKVMELVYKIYNADDSWNC